VVAGLIMVLLSVPWLLVFWPLWFFILLNAVSNVVACGFIYAGVSDK
jgi:hypothetical protein